MSKNIMINQLNLVYTPADMTLMTTNVNTNISKIPPDATLTEEERAQSAYDINVVNKIFSEDALNEALSNGATILPQWIDVTNMQTDFTFFEQSDQLISLHLNAVQRLSDAQRIAGRECYKQALKIYEAYKAAADAGVPGAQASYDKLKVRFDKIAGVPPQPNP